MSAVIFNHLRLSLFLFLCISPILGCAHALAEGDDNSKGELFLGLGAGGLFYEGDKENRTAQLYQIKASIAIDPSFSMGINLGLMPHLQEDPSGKRAFNGDSYADLIGLEMRYHFNGDFERDFDPFLGLTGGIMRRKGGMPLEFLWSLLESTLEDDSPEDDSSEGDSSNECPKRYYYGLVLCTAYRISKSLSLRGDYSLVAVGSRPKINHHAMLSIGYRYTLK